MWGEAGFSHPGAVVAPTPDAAGCIVVKSDWDSEYRRIAVSNFTPDPEPTVPVIADNVIRAICAVESCGAEIYYQGRIGSPMGWFHLDSGRRECGEPPVARPRRESYQIP